MCVRTHLCLTLCEPMEPTSSSVHGISQGRMLEWADISYVQGIFPTQGWNLYLLSLLHYRQISYHCATWEALSPKLFS